MSTLGKLRPWRITVLRARYLIERRWRKRLNRHDPALRLAIAITGTGLLIIATALLLPLLWERRHITQACYSPISERQC